MTRWPKRRCIHVWERRGRSLRYAFAPGTCKRTTCHPTGLCSTHRTAYDAPTMYGLTPEQVELVKLLETGPASQCVWPQTTHHAPLAPDKRAPCWSVCVYCKQRVWIKGLRLRR